MMKRLKHILIVSLSLLFTLNVAAQDGKQGSVVVHSDPRLSLLVRKPHNMEVSASAVVKHKSVPGSSVRSGEIKSSAVRGKKVKEVTVANAAPYKPIANQKANKKGITKINNAEASTTGHAGGWSPPARNGRVVGSGKGFRVQIYNGPDRSKAIERKTEFMRNYPGVPSYLSYITPCFRVKVGDYRNRNDALGMLKEANSAYSPCMIVPDIINVRAY
jgi:SPOR domain